MAHSSTPNSQALQACSTNDGEKHEESKKTLIIELNHAQHKTPQALQTSTFMNCGIQQYQVTLRLEDI